MTTKNDILLVLLVYVAPIMLVGGFVYGTFATVFYTADLKRYDGPVDCFIINLFIDNYPCTREDNLQMCYDIRWEVDVARGGLEYTSYISCREIDDKDQVERLINEHNINTTSECWYKVYLPTSLRWTKYIPDPVHVIISWSIAGIGLLLILIGIGICYSKKDDQSEQIIIS